MARRQTAVRPSATIRAVAVQRLAEGVACTDPGIAALLERYGIPRARSIDPYAFIPLRDYVAVLEELAVLTGKPFFGAEMARGFRPADIGPVGLMFSLSSTLRNAFTRLDRYLSAFQTSTSSGLMMAGEHALWTYRIADEGIWPRRQDAEYALVATCGLIQGCLTTPWIPVEVHFEHSAPADAARLRRMLGAPVLFDQPTNGLLLEARDVDRLIRREDPDLMQALERHVTELLKVPPGGDGVTAQVERLIGIFLGNRPVTINSIATMLGLPGRSLQRRLAEEGTSLRALVREHRMHVAATRLQSRGSMAALASALGYSDPSAVSRAYRMWTGRPPVRGRSSKRKDPAFGK